MVTSLQTSAQLTSVLELDVKPLVELRSRLERGGSVAAHRRHGDRRQARRRRPPRASGAQRPCDRERDRAARGDQRRRRRRDGRGARRTGRGRRRPALARGDQRAHRRARGARARPLADAGRARRRDVHRLERRHPPGRHHDRDPQPAPGRDPLDRPHPRPPRRDARTAAIAVRPTMQACLTFDHRAVDGGPAAAFLATLEQSVARLSEDPA